MSVKPGNKPPHMSIDEALEMYLAIACPQGLPEGEAGEKILKALRGKIAKDRPEWAEASALEIGVEKADAPGRYSQLKARIAEEARREDIPEDPEERYLYLRRKEARENSLRKKGEVQEATHENDLRQSAIERKRAKDAETLKRAAMIKKLILERAGQKMSPQMGGLTPMENESPALEGAQQGSVGFSETAEIRGKRSYEGLKNETMPPEDSGKPEGKPGRKNKPDAGEWFRDFKSLSMEDRAESIKKYNTRKREMLSTREDLMWSRRPSLSGDRGLSMDDGGFELDADLSLDPDDRSSGGLSLE